MKCSVLTFFLVSHFYFHPSKEFNAYEKFQLTFSSMNVCGRRRSHKVYLCRESIKAVYGPNVDLRFDDDYDEAKCRKRIRIPIHFWNDANFNPGAIQQIRSMKKTESFYKVREVSLNFLHCPRMMPANRNDFVYLASNLGQRSVVFYMRTNDPLEYFDMTIIVNQLDTEKIEQHGRRTRFTLYPLENERREQILESKRNYLLELEENINSYSSVQRPTTIAKVDEDRLNQIADTPRPIRLIQKRRLVEDIVIKYSQIKTMKLPYKRFEMMYRSLDICELPRKLKTILCEDIDSKYLANMNGADPDVHSNFHSTKSSIGQLSDDESYYTPKEREDRCTRSEIHLAIREIENLKARSFVMWKCSADRDFGHTSTFFIAKCHLRNTVLVFRIDNTSKDDKSRIYSDSVVTEIDRDSLALILLADNIL